MLILAAASFVAVAVAGFLFCALLDRLEAAHRPRDMDLPGFRLHGLKGQRKGVYAVSVSGNWRLMFRFDGEDAVDVDLEDYHS